MLTLLTRKPKPAKIMVADAEKALRYAKAAEEAKVIRIEETLDHRMLPLMRAVESIGLGFYDLARVEDYLNRIKPSGTTIVWKAATIETAKRYQKYTRLIPGDALAVIKAVTERCPDPLDFFVSDYEEVRPDPFLAVALAGGTLVGGPRRIETFRVIYHWDEPGFGRI